MRYAREFNMVCIVELLLGENNPMPSPIDDLVPQMAARRDKVGQLAVPK